MTEPKTLDTMIDKYMVVAGDYFSAAIDEIGKPAYELAMTMLRIDAASNILVGFVVVGMCLFFYKHFNIYLVKSKKEANKCDLEGLEIMEVVGKLILWVVGVTCAMMYLLDVWNWVGLFYPEVYGSHEMFMKVK